MFFQTLAFVALIMCDDITNRLLYLSACLGPSHQQSSLKHSLWLSAHLTVTAHVVHVSDRGCRQTLRGDLELAEGDAPLRGKKKEGVGCSFSSTPS